MKRKTLTIAISIFALIAIVSVGFASWVISRPDMVKESDPGTINVETVTNFSTLTVSSVSITYDNSASSIHFGKPADTASSNNPLSNSLQDHIWFDGKNAETECLRAHVKVTLNGAFDPANNSIALSFKAGKYETPHEDVTTFNDTDYKSIISKKYMSQPKIVAKGDDYEENELTSYTTKIESTLNEFEFDVVFQWGEAFTYVNPYWHYNTQAYSVDLATKAQTMLTEFNTLASAISYYVTVTITDN